MTSHLEIVIQLAQKCLEAMPVIILGSGASAPYGVAGMQTLKDHLLETITPSTEDVADWKRFEQSLSETNDLEKSLQDTSLPSSLISAIVHETRARVLADDLNVFEKIITNPRELVLSRLYRHLFNSTHGTLSIVTTNYDRLAEYAADAARFPHDTGFSNGYFRFFSTPATLSSSASNTRTVEIWKVHGSVDWYVNDDHLVVALPFHQNYPTSLRPLLVTPGTTKYEQTHQEPFRTIITKADSALERATSYLCIGYGFNDIHIQPKLVERVRHQTTPILILARTLTNNGREFLGVCKNSKYLALEQAGNATKAYFHEEPDGIELPNTSLWDFPNILDATIGHD